MRNLKLEEKIKLVSCFAEEILTPQDFYTLLSSKPKPRHYIGFEISGKIHLGNGLATMMVVKALQAIGVECILFLADWHTWINNKLGGDREVIKKVAVGYFKEGLKASLKCVGGDPEKVKFILGSDLYHHNDEYWATFVRVCKELSLSRVKKSLSIAGRQAGEGAEFGLLLYPPLQVTDIFGLKVDIAHGGTDQRKAHVLAREIGEKVAGYKPIALHNHLLLGLGKPPVWPIEKSKLREVWVAMKMSKSKPDTCIFIHDSPEEIRRKINSAFCPPAEVEFNPVLDWTKHLIFPLKGRILIKREKKYGGDVEYQNFQKLEEDYKTEALHPQDLKNAVAEALIETLDPARAHFSSGKPKGMLGELEKILA
ncbi:MAG: tyrosine--tRNA ligase [Microgenomates group bacterium]